MEKRYSEKYEEIKNSITSKYGKPSYAPALWVRSDGSYVELLRVWEGERPSIKVVYDQHIIIIFFAKTFLSPTHSIHDQFEKKKKKSKP